MLASSSILELDSENNMEQAIRQTNQEGKKKHHCLHGVQSSENVNTFNTNKN